MNRELELGCHSCHATRRNDAMRPIYAVANHVHEQIVRAEGRFRGAIRRVHGPADVDCADNELVVLCVGRDAELWIDSFVEHHLELGARHIFFLDNASTDQTVARAARYGQITVLSTDLSYSRFEVGMKRWMTRTFGRNRWSLFCDADELFDYPYSDRLELSHFLGYLKHHGYKAVTGQMLDMFSDRPFSELDSRPGDSLKDTYRYYDTSDLVESRDVYWIRDGQVQNDAIACNFGGIRKRFFGDDCWLLTKHPLVYADDKVGVCTYDSHFVTGAPVADVSTVLFHYKYVGTLPERAKASVESGWHKESAAWYGGLSSVLTRDPSLCLRRDSARELESIQDIVDSGFLAVTKPYLDWVDKYGGRTESRGQSSG